MVAAQIYEIVFIPFQKSVKFCFFWRKMGGSWVGREHLEQSECCLEGLEGLEHSECCLEGLEHLEHSEHLEGLEHSVGLGGEWDFFRGAIACLR